MKKLIGIPLWNQGETSVGATKSYLTWAKQFGSVVILSPDTFIPNLDLLILPGGKDLVNGNDKDFSYYNSDGERFLEYFDQKTLPLYIKNQTPIWGTCRGFQSLLRHFGANLLQHIYWNHGISKDEGDIAAHKLHFTERGTGLLMDLGVKSIPDKTGSWHHQGIFNKDVPKEFEVLAYSPDIDNYDLCLAEYVIHKSLPIAGSQTHPERTYHHFDKFIINHLINKKK